MFLPSDMMCLVQGFQQPQQPPQQDAKERRFRRLPFIRRKKSSTAEVEKDDSQLLRPASSRDTTSPLPCNDKRGLKQQLSGSAPSMTCAPLDPPPSLTPTTCRSRQKKFLRHFNVDQDEKVIDYYSCALVADILLQGHLYISKNYYAFYSNVFGYVTKLLIPLSSVVNVTKEKTAFILPNAVGVTTTEHRHVFSSLLSRDTTYRLMVQVWRNANIIPPEVIASVTEEETLVRPILLREESSSASGSEEVYEVKSANLPVPAIPQNQGSNLDGSVAACETETHTALRLAALPRSTVLLAAATALLIALFLSASVLMYRLSMLHHHMATRQAPPTRALQEVHEYLDINLNHVYKVRQSLEVLSLLLESELRDKVYKGDLDHQPAEVQEQNTVLTQEADSRQSNLDLSS